jgi:hypothetical protein
MSKIRIKIGSVEVEYEGTDDFLRDELPLLLDKLATLGARVPTSGQPGGENRPETDKQVGGDRHLGGDSGPPANSGAVNTGLGTCSTVAATLGAKTGPELAMAAAARMIIGDSRTSFTRKELLDEMKSATAYYNKNYGSNLSSTITGLVKAKKFREVAKDTYGLAADTISELRSRLAS